MRIVVCSDSHGDAEALRELMSKEPSAEVVLHLGDGEREFSELRPEYPDKIFRGVKGNCDWGSTAKTTDLLVVERKRIFFAHGHTLHVKDSVDTIWNMACSLKADVALFGHTHVPFTELRDGILLFNPGSLSQPRRGERTYGVLEITDFGIDSRILSI